MAQMSQMIHSGFSVWETPSQCGRVGSPESYFGCWIIACLHINKHNMLFVVCHISDIYHQVIQGQVSGLAATIMSMLGFKAVTKDVNAHTCYIVMGKRVLPDFRKKRGRKFKRSSIPGGAGKARFNVATPTYEARTRPLHVQHIITV